MVFGRWCAFVYLVGKELCKSMHAVRRVVVGLDDIEGHENPVVKFIVFVCCCGRVCFV